MTLKEQLREDLNAARRERDKLRTTVLTSVLSDIRNQEIELRAELTDDGVIEVVHRSIKRRLEAVVQMRAGNREDLAEKEEAEAEILAEYLPPPLEEAAVRVMVRAAIEQGAGNVGAVMSRIMPALKGRFDGKEANRIVREELSG